MARFPRCVLSGRPQHVIQRGINRKEIFCAEADYRFYPGKLAAAAARHACKVHAYVLMTNHVHLPITPHTEHGIGKTMQALGCYYVQYYNYHYRRTGTRWEWNGAWSRAERAGAVGRRNTANVPRPIEFALIGSPQRS
jgi:putative transposase